MIHEVGGRVAKLKEQSKVNRLFGLVLLCVELCYIWLNFFLNCNGVAVHVQNY